jgi:nitrate reductase (NAD(P)H)
MHRWVPVKLTNRKSVSEDTRTYTFQLPDDKLDLGLGNCQHVQLGFHLRDRMLIRSYTPTKPLLPAPSGDHQDKNKKSEGSSDIRDGAETFDLTVKTYFPTDPQPGGAMSNILDCMPLGEEIEIRGPTGEIVYNGNGKFTISDKSYAFNKVSLVLGGSGITPGHSLIARILLSENDSTQIRVIDANKTEQDILLKKELEKMERDSKGQLKVCHVLSHAGEDWKGEKGHVNAVIIRGNLFAPGEGEGAFICGPPAMIQKAALPALRDWGYNEDENVFGFRGVCGYFGWLWNV